MVEPSFGSSALRSWSHGDGDRRGACGGKSPRHRASLLVAFSTFVFVVGFTLLYICPINATIFAADTGTAQETRAVLDRFIFADEFRFVVGCVSFGALLWAFRLPSPGAIGHRRS